jgi:hypothetical protein
MTTTIAILIVSSNLAVIGMLIAAHYASRSVGH